MSRLRASAFKAEGEQKEKSGDLSGAVAAFDEAVKLNSSLGLKTERAVLHVKLGEQAVAKQDYAAAATELDARSRLISQRQESSHWRYRCGASGRCLRAGSYGCDQTAALAALSSIQSVDAQNEELPVLRKRVTAAVLKRGESVADKAPDSALKDYETALSLELLRASRHH